MRTVERFGPDWRRHRRTEPLITCLAVISGSLLLAMLGIVIGWLLILQFLRY